MEPKYQRPKLLVIVGPTASGKSQLALKIAKDFNGEIIAADSRTVYKGMNIGTAKPSFKEQKLIPHWGIDIIEPGQTYSAAQFKQYAEDKKSDINNRGKLAVLVGGTGLYIDSLIFDFNFPPTESDKKRRHLEDLSLQQLQELVIQRGYKLPKNSKNHLHLVNTILRRGQAGTRQPKPSSDVLAIGLNPPTAELKKLINKRAETIFNQGVIKETQRIIDKYGEAALLASGGIVYKICLRFLKGEINLSQAKELFKRQDWQYARRQKTWFRRNKYIQWYSSPDQAYKVLSKVLNK